MGDISPVLASFLEGQRTRTSTLQSAQDTKDKIEARKQRDQQLKETIRQFDERLKMEQMSHDLALKNYEATRAHQMELTRQNVIRMINEGAIAKPQQPVVQGVSGNIPGIPSSTYQMPAMYNSPMGSMDVSEAQTPEMRIPGMVEQARALSAAKAEGELPSELKKINAQSDIKRELEGMEFKKLLAIADLKGQYGLMVQGLRNENSNLRTMMEMEQRLNDRYGTNDPEQIFKNSVSAADDLVWGRRDVGDLPTYYKPKVLSILENKGMAPIGKREMDSLNRINSSAKNLMMYVNDFNQKIKASESKGGMLGLLGFSRIPGSDIERYTKGMKAAINDLAQVSAISIRGYDSDKEKAAMEALLPSVKDSPEVRRDNMKRLRKRIDTNVGMILNNYSPKQKQMYKEYLIQNNPFLVNPDE